ncbi:ABC transporter permease [Nitratireductor rhodophyticola]|uniref:ABC transporter permease n=2 Tax=Nitratireductor TaxID=245876 RepID=A0ABS7R4N6_9HYPH|nr:MULTISPECIES: ABC transporter permease [Alphaproteobacteria]MBY6022919.1 ABC transporter permease [Nitratireductor sp. DP7N14-4]MBY8915881.1 ABC transporter permease [Nitratireductor rhodophyticola]MEC9243832.1 ABC transporter permease [Pseudomonadota bacterium]MBN7758126.1 ABC transporter permease [Nitratireductor aquimarinus]MBY8921244.1 ABC transporter permease [Nitratireductor rhodophyticola]
MSHLKAMASRALQLALVLWAVVTILFLMFRLMPGNPMAAYIDPTFTVEQQEALMAQFGLDKPLWEQYLIYLGNLLQGELGQSFRYREPVAERLMTLLPNTLILTFSSLIVAYTFGILAGAYLAWRRGSVVENTAIPLVLTTRAMPEFWLGMVLLAVFSFWLGWFPAGGTRPAGASYDSLWALYTSREFLSYLALPALTLAIYSQGLPLLLMRSNMLDVMKEDFVTMARIKGLSNWSVVVRHAARNALLPVMTSFAIAVGYQLQGNVVVESVFSWPGLGRELVNAVSASDYPLAQGAFLMIAVVVILMNLIADLLYSLLDPRISHA